MECLLKSTLLLTARIVESSTCAALQNAFPRSVGTLLLLFSKFPLLRDWSAKNHWLWLFEALIIHGFCMYPSHRREAALIVPNQYLSFKTHFYNVPVYHYYNINFVSIIVLFFVYVRVHICKYIIYVLPQRIILLYINPFIFEPSNTVALS
jgi:hypothetical protein